MKINRLKQLVRKNTSYPPRHFLYNIHREWSIYLTYLFIKLKISPNSITISAILLSIAGLILIGLNEFYLGIFLYYFSFVLDKCDGEVSRYQNSESLIGIFLDELYHLFANSLFFFSISVYIYHKTFDLHIVLIGLACSFLYLADRFIYKLKYTIQYKSKSQKRDIYYYFKNRIIQFLIIEDIVMYLFFIAYLTNLLTHTLIFYLVTLTIILSIRVFISMKNINEY